MTGIDLNAKLFDALRPGVMEYCPLPWKVMQHTQEGGSPIVLDANGAAVAMLSESECEAFIERVHNGRGTNVSYGLVDEMFRLLMLRLHNQEGDSVDPSTWSFNDGVIRSQTGLALASLSEGLFDEFVVRATQAGQAFYREELRRTAWCDTAASQETPIDGLTVITPEMLAKLLEEDGTS